MEAKNCSDGSPMTWFLDHVTLGSVMSTSDDHFSHLLNWDTSRGLLPWQYENTLKRGCLDLRKLEKVGQMIYLKDWLDI